MKKNEQKMKLDHVVIDVWVNGNLLRLKCNAMYDNTPVLKLDKLQHLFASMRTVDLVSENLVSINGKEIRIQLYSDDFGCLHGRIFTLLYDKNEVWDDDSTEVSKSEITNVVFVCKKNDQYRGYIYCHDKMVQIGSHEHICSYRL